MAEVMRNGVLVLVPRKISDHIPTVPIHSTDRFVAFEMNENLGKNQHIYKFNMSSKIKKNIAVKKKCKFAVATVVVIQ